MISEYTKILALATRVLENEEKAKEWLQKPQYGLGGVIPLELLKTEAGAKEVEELLWRIEYGIVS